MAGLLASVLIDGRDDRPNNLEPWDYVQLRRLLDEFVADGRVRRVPAFNPLHPGLDEEWFLDVETGDIYSLLLADEKIRPKWEKVDVFDRRSARQQEKDWHARMGEVEPERGHLAQIPRGRQDSATMQYLHSVLEKTLNDGTVEKIERTDYSLKTGTTAQWFRDNTTGEVFGLFHDTESGEFRWERIAEMRKQ